ncbi:MAG: PilN domain-containing protein [Desulfobacterales bacterium]|nr:PilN domain-containing protein [Desulfobacterales bacterium]
MALREVNLIPAEMLYKKHVARHLFLWAGSLVLTLGLIFGFYQYQLHAVLLKNRPKTTLEDMHIQLGATIAEIKISQQEIEQLSRQDAFLRTLNTNQPFSEVLLKLSDIINAQTWLTRLTIHSSPENESVAAALQLYGYSLSNDHVGNFLNRLSEAPLFHNVVLRYAREAQNIQSPRDSESKLKVIQFQIDCDTPRFKSN